MGKGPVIILSGPSGAGKSTVIGRLLALALRPGHHPMRLSVSATTRGPRPGEQSGVHYHFWTREQFDQAVQAGEFLEWAEVYGQCYGTLRSEVDPYRERGTGVLLDIDVQGADQVRRQYPESLTLFLLPPSLEVLERRLRDRKKDSEASIQRRLAAARRELDRSGEYAFRVVNDRLDDAVAELDRIIERHWEGEQHAG